MRIVLYDRRSHGHGSIVPGCCCGVDGPGALLSVPVTRTPPGSTLVLDEGAPPGAAGLSAHTGPALDTTAADRITPATPARKIGFFGQITSRHVRIRNR